MPAPPRDPKAFTRWFRLDYFRRPRSLRTVYGPVLLLVLLLCAGAAVASLWPGGSRAAFQAAPVSTPHALVADRCEACHTRAFHTAWRLWPGDAEASSVGDEACLQCHEAGRHNAQQLKFADEATGQSRGCALCHREHRGDAALARLPDSACTQCHADLRTLDGGRRYAARITRFEVDHPPFGAWRRDGLRDPGTITFSHKAHLELAKKWAAVAADEGGGEGSHWRAVVKEQSQALEKQDCQYCHKLDAARRYVAPVLYEDHCAACHPLLPQLTGDWPPPLARPFRQTPLHHPGPKETAANVRGELLERFSMLVLRGPAPAVSFPDEEVRPFPLQRPLPPLDEKQRQILGQRFHAERSLFDPKGGEPLPGFKDLNFDVKGGCAFCHKEEGRYEDGTPRYEPPRLGERWKDLKFPVERFDAEAYRFDRNHWFPHANFDHDAHRMTTCAECHAARDSEKSADVLMPGIDTCKKCHNGTSAGARSDCLECHGYHDHSQDQGTNRNPPALDAILGTAGR